MINPGKATPEPNPTVLRLARRFFTRRQGAGWLLAALLVLAPTSIMVFKSRQPAQARPAQEFRVVGYLPDYRINRVKPAQWKDYLTDLVYFSIEPTADGGLDLARFRSNAWHRTRQVAVEEGILTFIGVGGWGRGDGFPGMATNGLHRAKFIMSLTDFCLREGFDGADFDWEFPRGYDQRKGYNDLLIETHQQFRAHGLQVSVAAGIGMGFRTNTYEALDLVSIMSYNHDGPHATYEDSLSDIEQHLAFGVPNDKLVLGLPFYGRHIESRSKTLGYRQLLRHYPQLREGNLDEVDGYYLNGRNTILRKIQLAREWKLAGVMIWEIGLDSPEEETSLLRAIHEDIRRSGGQAFGRSGSPAWQNLPSMVQN